jgi:hypothetical protein
MSDLDQSLELIASFFAAVVILLILFTWLEATMSTDREFVVTSTPLDREWANARVVEGGLVEFVRESQDQPGGDIGVHASISCRSGAAGRRRRRRTQAGDRSDDCRLGTSAP